jgi:TonB family protein
LLACAEASVIMPNGNRMILAISVGTFKKGITGQPTFFRAVIESGEQLYQVTRLRDLTSMLQAPRKMAPLLPELPADSQPLTLRSNAANSSLTPIVVDAPPEPSREEEKPPAPPPAPPSTPQKISQSVLEGLVLKKRLLVYPPAARYMNAIGKVDVRIVISESGKVIEAEFIKGHPALKNAALEAAREWVYKPTMLNGVPTKVETVLTFNFSPPSQ